MNYKGDIKMKNTILETIEEFEENKCILNEAQRQYIKDNYNYNMHVNFEYAEGHLCYMFKGKLAAINNLKYYVGLEYEEENIDTYIQSGNEALIVYDNNDRVEEFIEALRKLE